MKKILQIVDTYNWAIGTLSKAVVGFNPQYSWECIEIHPKDLEGGKKYDLNQIKEKILNADVIDCQYWRTLSQLLDLVPEIKTKKIVLTHHNEKNLLSADWSDVAMHIAKTKYSYDVLAKEYGAKKVTLIYNSYDPNEFEYIDKPIASEKVVGYVGRIAPWKGLKEVARACYELGYPLMIMGKHDKMDYFGSIPQEHRDNIRWDFFNCDNKDKKAFYESITLYVGNSGGGREVGTLGLIEALACGVPVVTTPSGIAKDILENDVNALVVDYDDYDELKENIQRLMESPALQQRLRKTGWETIRNYTDERMGWDYGTMFSKLMNDGPLVSIVLPATIERAENVKEILESLNEQTYKNIDVAICWDNTAEELDGKLDQFREIETNYPYMHVMTNRQGYNLAMARNLGVIVSHGKYLLFCDSRLKPKPNAIEEFIKNVPEDKSVKFWLFGNKGGDKPHFVENFSFIKRDQLVHAGMFNERIIYYGGMSQELRERFAGQGFKLNYIPEAEADQMIKSSMTPEKRKGIIGMKNLLYKLGLN